MYEGIRAQLLSDPSAPIDIKGTPMDWNSMLRKFAGNFEPIVSPFHVFVHPRTAYTLNDSRVQDTFRWHYPPELRMKSAKWYRRRNKVRLRMKRERDEIYRAVGAEYDAMRDAEFASMKLSNELLVEVENAIMGG